MECQIRITYDELHAQDAYQIYKIALRSKTNIKIYGRKHEHQYDKYKKTQDLLLGLCYSWICIFFLLQKHTQKDIHRQIQTNIYVYGVHRNKFCFYHTIEWKAWICENISTCIWVTRRRRPLKIICTQKCTIGTSVKSWFSIHKEVWTNFFLHENKIYDPQRKLYVSVQPTPQEG